MRKDKTLILEKRIAVAFIGIAVSIIGNKYFNEWINYISYAVLFIIGYFSSTQKNALIYGVLFGCALFLTNFFIMDGYTYYMHIIIFGIFFVVGGLLLGLAVTYIGYSIKVLIKRR